MVSTWAFGCCLPQGLAAGSAGPSYVGNGDAFGCQSSVQAELGTPDFLPPLCRETPRSTVLRKPMTPT